MTPRPTIAFLFINGIHHVYHAAMTAMALSESQRDFRVLLVSSHREQTRVIEQIKARFPRAENEIVTLPEPIVFRYLNFINKAYPPPTGSLKKARRHLRDAVAIVSTSHATKRHCDKYGIVGPKHIYHCHGCGDGKYGFETSLQAFDLMLTPGPYYRQRLIDETRMPPEKLRVIGWPKLDLPVDGAALRKRLFTNNRPTVLYCPHWNPRLSSYREWGRDVLAYFSRSDKYNLIFAPHVQLRHWAYHYKYNTDLREYACDHLHVDWGSTASADTSYLRAADIYLGDVSSMVYEFVGVKPRPCVFLNTHGVKWRGDPNYRYWDMGPVVDSIAELDAKLTEAICGQGCIALQTERIREYLDLTAEPSSQRAARAVEEFARSQLAPAG